MQEVSPEKEKYLVVSVFSIISCKARLMVSQLLLESCKRQIRTINIVKFYSGIRVGDRCMEGNRNLTCFLNSPAFSKLSSVGICSKP